MRKVTSIGIATAGETFVERDGGGRYPVVDDDRGRVVVRDRQLDEHEDEHVDDDQRARDVRIEGLVVGIIVVQRHEH